MTDTATPEIPLRAQIADAQAHYQHAADLFAQARHAAAMARSEYRRARATDPAGQSADDARNAWAEAQHDEVDARAAMEQAVDELDAVHRQTATYAVMEEAPRG